MRIAIRHVVSELGLWVRTFAAAAVYAALIVTFGFQVAHVEGRSMEPTLHDQDRLVVNKLAYRLHDPAVGDVVMLLHPNTPETALVKRVVGAPGDSIAFQDGVLFRNGRRVEETFVAAAMRSFESKPPVIVPEGFYFVLGDHRNDSADSRVFGVVPKRYILGKVQVRWWPPVAARTFEP